MKVWLSIFPAVVLMGAAPADPYKKVTICHVAAQAKLLTLSVGEAALGAHLAHGDGLGACPTGCAANPAACDDGNPCTSDSCAASGACEHTAISCDDDNPCTADRCDVSLGCVSDAADGVACDDGNACTSGDVCLASSCHGAAVAGCCITSAACGDGDSCTTDLCVDGRCSNAPLACGVTSACFAGYCDAVTGTCATSPVSCDDSNVCTADGCDPSLGCVHQPVATPPQAHETSCADGADNDCDGLVDALDPDCLPPDPGLD